MSGSRETVLQVSGMTCGGCARRIERALRDRPGVSAIEVRLREGTVRVTHEVERATIDALLDAVRGAGFAATA